MIKNVILMLDEDDEYQRIAFYTTIKNKKKCYLLKNKWGEYIYPYDNIPFCTDLFLYYDKFNLLRIVYYGMTKNGRSIKSRTDVLIDLHTGNYVARQPTDSTNLEIFIRFPTSLGIFEFVETNIENYETSSCFFIEKQKFGVTHYSLEAAINSLLTFDTLGETIQL